MKYFVPKPDRHLILDDLVKSPKTRHSGDPLVDGLQAIVPDELDLLDGNLVLIIIVHRRKGISIFE